MHQIFKKCFIQKECSFSYWNVIFWARTFTACWFEETFLIFTIITLGWDIFEWILHGYGQIQTINYSFYFESVSFVSTSNADLNVQVFWQQEIL